MPMQGTKIRFVILDANVYLHNPDFMRRLIAVARRLTAVTSRRGWELILPNVGDCGAVCVCVRARVHARVRVWWWWGMRAFVL